MPIRSRGEKLLFFAKLHRRASTHALYQTPVPPEQARRCPGQQKTEFLFANSPPPHTASRCLRRFLTYSHTHAQIHLEEALDSLDQQCRPLSQGEYLSLLQACNKCRSLTLAQHLHAHFAHYRLDTNAFLGENLLVTLTKCGALDNALQVFHSLPSRTAFAWTALISGLTDWDQPLQALVMYQKMLDDGAEPDSYTFVSLFKACGIIPNLEAGQKLHMEARQKGVINELLVGNTLVSMYGKCGAVVEAECVFLELPKRDVVTWNVMISLYLKKEQSRKALCLYRQMCEEAGSLQDDHTIMFVLQAVRALAEGEALYFLTKEDPRAMSFEIGRALHADMRHKYLSSSHVAGNTLISMYGSCGAMAHAMNAFHGLTKPDIVSKTAILSAFIEQGQDEKALQLYCRLSQEEIGSNHQTFLMAIQACGNLAEKEEACILEDGEFIKANSLKIGRAIHVDARARGLDTSLFVANTLISMYGKCGAITEAEIMFERFAHTDIISWNSMLSAYVEEGKANHALRLYRQMREEGFEPDRQTFLTVLQACDDMAIQMSNDLNGNAVEGCVTSSFPFEVGIALHADVRRRGLASDVFVGTTLIRMYGKFGCLAEAESVFCSLSCVDLVSCTAILTMLVEQGEEEKSLSFFKKMLEAGTILDEITLVGVLQASWKSGRLDIARQLDFVIVSGGLDSKSNLECVALIQAYGSSGSVSDARAILDGLSRPNLAVWNACIAANTGEVTGRTSFQMFEQMQFECFCPDAPSFASILSACTYAGLVEAGIAYLVSMSRNFSLREDVNHLLVMVDILGRAGDLVGATYLVKKVPKKAELSAWLCLLSACRIHGNVELGKSAFNHIVGLQTNDPCAYVLMSNMCLDTRL
ncbi:hypothetical protein GOP47_0017203 [Adiantum capillus-veneris]|uniref:Pentatricopeptide repeat-containing protein n=1 Tax=Adiantum capillus-veneris TaxID=13818 RepID=A0A9D4ZB12_ADICA|nr:hypothetical protein GOP47_0017203 [Adiantum capillus-veneris]